MSQGKTTLKMNEVLKCLTYVSKENLCFCVFTWMQVNEHVEEYMYIYVWKPVAIFKWHCSGATHPVF